MQNHFSFEYKYNYNYCRLRKQIRNTHTFFYTVKTICTTVNTTQHRRWEYKVISFMSFSLHTHSYHHNYDADADADADADVDEPLPHYPHYHWLS